MHHILKSSSVSDLFSLCKSGVFFIRNSSKKRIDIRTSNNIGRALYLVIKEASDGFLVPKILQRDLLENRVEVGILEEVKDRPTQNLRLAYWVDFYKKLGYSFYRQKNAFPVKYKVKKEYIVNHTDKFIFDYNVFVCLVHSKTRVIVGVFKTNKEADEFIELNYKDSIINFIYANNELTKKYNETHKLRLNRKIKLERL